VPPAQDDACQARQIWHALRAVDPDKRRHMLALAMGYTHEEIGTLEGLAPGTIKSSVSRGRRQLRHLLPDFSLDPN
jgi:DNA-directed RNA polymerase specialized sigma24 family protein